MKRKEIASKEYSIKVGMPVSCPALETKGVVIQVFDETQFIIKLEGRKLNSMCIKVGNAYKLSTTKNPKWHTILVDKS